MVAPEQLTDLVTKAQSGDRQAFEQLVELSRERLANVVAARVGAHLRAQIDVDDVIQETFTRAFESIGRFRSQGEDSLHRWFATIAEHVILEVARERQRRPKFQLYQDPSGSAATPSKLFRRNERFERLEQALNHLSPEHREVIVLSRIERLKIDRIAERMRRSPDAVKQLLSRALKSLKESFGDTESLHLPDRRLNTGRSEDDHSR